MSQNSSNAFDRPLRVELKRSRTVSATLVALYAAAAAAWLWAPVPGWLRLALFGLLAGHFVCLYRLHATATSPSSVQALNWDCAAGWRTLQTGGGWQPAELRLPVFVSHRLVAARFKLARRKTCSVIVVPDRVVAEDFRRLRVRLIQSAHGHRD